MTPSRHLAALLLAAAALHAAPADAADPAPSRNTPVGRWTTIDDNTHKPSSIVRIWEQDGKLSGSVEKIIDDDPAKTCTKCDGDRKDKPIVGMVILWDMARDGDEWSGGRILDPDNGSTYKCSMEVAEGGAKLKVRGYIGFSLLGRTQTWLRAD